jgi:hypothetical protein
VEADEGLDVLAGAFLLAALPESEGNRGTLGPSHLSPELVAILSMEQEKIVLPGRGELYLGADLFQLHPHGVVVVPGQPREHLQGGRMAGQAVEIQPLQTGGTGPQVVQDQLPYPGLLSGLAEDVQVVGEILSSYEPEVIALVVPIKRC